MITAIDTAELAALRRDRVLLEALLAHARPSEWLDTTAWTLEVRWVADAVDARQAWALHVGEPLPSPEVEARDVGRRSA